MSDRIDLQLTDHRSGRFRIRQKVDLDEDNYMSGVKIRPSKPLMRGRIYIAEASVDLGSIFGELRLESEVIPRK
jgi:hypothetical protein